MIYDNLNSSAFIHNVDISNRTFPTWGGCFVWLGNNEYESPLSALTIVKWNQWAGLVQSVVSLRIPLAEWTADDSSKQLTTVPFVWTVQAVSCTITPPVTGHALVVCTLQFVLLAKCWHREQETRRQKHFKGKRDYHQHARCYLPAGTSKEDEFSEASKQVANRLREQVKSHFHRCQSIQTASI